MSKTKKKSDRLPPEVEYYNQFYSDVLHTGSRVICSPPVKNTDDDWVLLCRPDCQAPLEGILGMSGWQLGGSSRWVRESNGWMTQVRDDEGFGENFKSYRKKELNLILTSKPEFFEKFRRATEITRSLNVLDKSDRVLIFEAVFKDQWPKDEADVRKFLDTLQEARKKKAEEEEAEQVKRNEAWNVKHKILMENLYPVAGRGIG